MKTSAFLALAIFSVSCMHLPAQVAGTQITVLPHTSTSGTPSAVGEITFRSLNTAFNVNMVAPNGPHTGGASSIKFTLPDYLPAAGTPGGCIFASNSAGTMTCGDTPDNTVNIGSTTSGFANLYLSTAAWSPLYRVYQTEPPGSATTYFDSTVTGSGVYQFLDSTAAVIYQYDGTTLTAVKPFAATQMTVNGSGGYITPAVTDSSTIGVSSSHEFLNVFSKSGSFSLAITAPTITASTEVVTPTLTSTSGVVSVNASLFPFNTFADSLGDNSAPWQNGYVTNLILFGKPTFNGPNTNGTTATSFGSNCPATTCTSPYTWVESIVGGFTVYIPVFK